MSSISKYTNYEITLGLGKSQSAEKEQGVSIRHIDVNTSFSGGRRVTGKKLVKELVEGL